MNLKKSSCVFLYCVVFLILGNTVFAQVLQRPRFAPPSAPAVDSRVSQIPSNPTVKTNSYQRPTLTNDIRVVQPPIANNLVKKTVAAAPSSSSTSSIISNLTSSAINQRLSQAMDSKLGIRYRYGATSLNSIDCSGLVWMVFRDAGINFERSSASNYWQNFEPVYGDDRYKFGTLVFFNRLGHIGIVVNEKGFYHASSSKGVTYSSFEGYWSSRIVGFRRVPVQSE